MPKIIDKLRATYLTNPAAALNMLPELFQAEEDGLIIEQPYKPGKELFWIDEYANPHEIKTMYFVSMFAGYYFGIGDMKLNNFIISSAVYETREAAEKRLESEKK